MFTVLQEQPQCVPELRRRVIRETILCHAGQNQKHPYVYEADLEERL